jgi:hypothetical protein
LATDDLERRFPALVRSRYEVTSSEDVRYNCIAWAAGDVTRKWWPRRGYYWPKAPDDESLEEFTRAFARLGYEECVGVELEEGFGKVAIYAGPLGPAHMARQLPDGSWTSKCGDWEDISHELRAIEGEAYGQIVRIMRRRQTRGRTY